MAIDVQSTVKTLQSALGEDAVITALEEREYFSRDLSWEPRAVAEIVVQPGSVEELTAAVTIANDAGLAVVPRGGGMSYTRRSSILATPVESAHRYPATDMEHESSEPGWHPPTFPSSPQRPQKHRIFPA